MPAVIFFQEGTPDDYPAPPAGLSEAAAVFNAAVVWQRLEAWVSVRYTERDVEWIVEGCGEWAPPLTPTTIATTERWNGDAWETVELPPSPLGYRLDGVGPYRFTGVAGDDDADVPAVVTEAFRRLVEYMAGADNEDRPGARVHSTAVPDVFSETVERSPAWMALALANSGAADLLRTFRRTR